MKELRCYEGEIQSEKASSHCELNPGHLCLEPPVLCHWATIAGELPTPTILHMYCTGGIECLSCTPGRHIEDCEGWWLSDCRGSVAEHWRLKPEGGVLGSTTGNCWPFHFSSRTIQHAKTRCFMGKTARLYVMEYVTKTVNYIAVFEKWLNQQHTVLNANSK